MFVLRLLDPYVSRIECYPSIRKGKLDKKKARAKKLNWLAKHGNQNDRGLDLRGRGLVPCRRLLHDRAIHAQP